MENISDKKKTVQAERKRGSSSSDSSDSSDSSSSDSEGERRSSGEAVVQVHASPEKERSSPDYMETRTREERRRSSSSSSSSSSDNQEKADQAPAVQTLEELNSEAHDGSRRSSTSSSASSASPATPCDDPPATMDDVVEDLLLAFKQRESVADRSLIHQENGPADPSQPEITLFVKVRHVQRSAQPEQMAYWCKSKSLCRLLFFYSLCTPRPAFQQPNSAKNKS